MIKDKYRKALYDIWAKMIDRCYNENNISYKYYGAKGIKVCERWLSSFDNFNADIGIRPAGTSLDRKDSKGNYEPSNCKWSTINEQNNNKSDTRKINFNGKTQSMTAWALEINTSPAALHHRLYKMNLPIDIALTIPFSRSNSGKSKLNILKKAA